MKDVAIGDRVQLRNGGALGEPLNVTARGPEMRPAELRHVRVALDTGADFVVEAGDLEPVILPVRADRLVELQVVWDDTEMNRLDWHCALSDAVERLLNG